MRRLVLLRHAKADRPDGVPDKDRSLSPRGVDDSRKMGALLRERSLVAGVALVSTARRTLETWQQLGLDGGELRAEPLLYDATADTILTLVRSIDDTASSVMVVGHNPGIHRVAVALSAPNTAGARELADGFPTCGLVVIDLPWDSWSEIGTGQGELMLFTTPQIAGW